MENLKKEMEELRYALVNMRSWPAVVIAARAVLTAWDKMQAEQKSEGMMIEEQSNQTLPSQSILMEALRQSVIDAACDETCPAMLDWHCARCDECPVGVAKPGMELHHDTERDIACWTQYYVEAAVEELPVNETGTNSELHPSVPSAKQGRGDGVKPEPMDAAKRPAARAGRSPARLTPRFLTGG